jgi:hypothetical protein
MADRRDIRKANKQRNQYLRRFRRKQSDDSNLRDPTMDRQYTQVNDRELKKIIHEYAVANGGKRITSKKLWQAYDAKFPGERRSESSVLSHVNKVQELKNLLRTFE